MDMTRLLSVALLAAMLAVGCGADGATSPTGIAAAPVSPAVGAAMEEAIGDEYRAETIYQGVIDDFGPFVPFVNVIGAEVRHSVSLARLFQNRGMPIPANSWTTAAVPHYGSVRDACVAGVTAERENVAIYDRHLALDLPADVRQVFESNRAASLFNHLPAFERCAS
jgi:hypothetical protein